MTFPINLYVSEFYPGDGTEGNLDPLGLAAIADYLAVKLVPGIRERQRHPRFLTSIVVGLSLFEDVERMLPEEEFKVDRWEAYEWLFVSGLVKTAPDSASISGLPGTEKARSSKKLKLPLCAERYLKTPSVFGFHGVYKLLAKTLDCEREDQLGTVGFELLDIWIREQKLIGFLGTGDGPGKKLRSTLVRSISQTLKLGQVNESWQWQYWDFFNTHLHHRLKGKKESEFLLKSLLTDSSNMRTEVINFYKSAECKKLIAGAKNLTERDIHKALSKIAPANLKSLLGAISEYETFARSLTDAFNAIREHLTKSKNVCSPSDVANLPSVKKASAIVPKLYQNAQGALAPLGQEVRFDKQFERFQEKMTNVDFVKALIEHHLDIQKNKLPEGKRPWFQIDEVGRFILRPNYYFEAKDVIADSYVHFYRSGSINSFLKDLGAI